MGSKAVSGGEPQARWLLVVKGVRGLKSPWIVRDLCGE